MQTQTPGLLVIDLQPAYARADNGCNHITPRLMCRVIEHIRSLPPDTPIHVLFVNEELSADTLPDVQSFWREHGADEALLERLSWHEKPYAFLRGWMDNGIDEDDIVSTLQGMRRLAAWDSRDLSPETLEQLCESGSQLIDPLLRDHDVESLLPALAGRDWTTCGGGRDECLLEVELVLRSADIRFERLDHLTY